MQMNLETPLHDSEFNAFRKLIYSIAGISLSERKRELVKSRLARRLRALALDSYSEYYRLLCDTARSADEIQHFTNCLTTNKTEFFRESHHFDYLREQYLLQLRERTLDGGDKKVRIWCAAASTGQEPYTLAMTLLDTFGVDSGWDLRILASDIDTQVLATAAEGVYPAREVEAIPAAHRARYFDRDPRSDNEYRVKDDVKRLVTFRQLNLNQPVWPINICFDAIFCRNVMIYFDQPTQRKLIEHFTEHLQPEGLLVIGHSESLFSISEEFEPLGDTIYKRKLQCSSDRRPRAAISTPASATSTPSAMPTAPALPAMPSAHGKVGEPRSPVSAATNSKHNSSLHRPALRDWRAYPVDAAVEQPSHTLIVGEYLASDHPCLMRTTLGSCVAACLFDAGNGIGGMNHFMLPESQIDERVSASYGVHAMELLINALMKLGVDRRRLSAKIFGGAHVVGSLDPIWDIGRRNIEFVREFLELEKIPVHAEHVGGKFARRLKFFPTSGKVLVQLLDKRTSVDVDAWQRQQGSQAIGQTTLQQNVTLF